MSEELAKKAISVTPFWLDAVMIVCIVHLAVSAWLASTGRDWVAIEWLFLLMREPISWLIIFLPPYALFFFSMLVWRERRRQILIWGGLTLFVVLVVITPRGGP